MVYAVFSGRRYCDNLHLALIIDISHFIAFDNVLDTHALITLMEKPGEIWSLTHTKNGVFRHIAEIVDPVTEQNARPGKKWIKEVYKVICELPSSY